MGKIIGGGHEASGLLPRSMWFFLFSGFSFVYLATSTSLSPWSSISPKFEVISSIMSLN